MSRMRAKNRRYVIWCNLMEMEGDVSDMDEDIAGQTSGAEPRSGFGASAVGFLSNRRHCRRALQLRTPSAPQLDPREEEEDEEEEFQRR